MILTYIMQSPFFLFSTISAQLKTLRSAESSFSLCGSASQEDHMEFGFDLKVCCADGKVIWKSRII